jgi:hypothetical protein
MRYRFAGAILAAVLLLACSFIWVRRNGGKSGVVKAQAAAGVPDISGVWRRSRRPPDNARKYTIFELAMSITSEEPAMTPWGAAKFKANKPNFGPRAVPLSQTNDPAMKCFPPGVPRIYLMRAEPVEIMQVPGRVVMLFEYDHFVRQIYTDGRPHAQDPPPSWMGDAIGRWEGDTLVIDTVGFNDASWLDNVGHPHSEQLHVIERLRRVDHDTMTIDTTIDDPKTYTKPWGGHAILELKPDWNLGEMVCEDDINFSDLQKKSEGNK